MAKQDRERIEVESAEELRVWLAAQPSTRPSAWVVHYKKHVADKHVSWPELVRACLCYGWIDGLVNSVDADRVARLISPRRAGSMWSALNRRHVAELEASGEMTDAGRAVIARARADGSWTFLDEIDALVVPPDLQAALDADSAVERGWNAYPKGEKKAVLYQLKSAKRPTTREQTSVANFPARLDSDEALELRG